MQWRRVSEEEFTVVLFDKLEPLREKVNSVTGVGRSGAICAVYGSHYLGIPFLPYSRRIRPVDKLKPVLLGEDFKEGAEKYSSRNNNGLSVW